MRGRLAKSSGLMGINQSSDIVFCIIVPIKNSYRDHGVNNRHPT